MKEVFCTATGIVGSAIAGFFGGWSTGIATLLICMAVDYMSGLLVAGIFKKSQKTANGALESNACWKGLAKKVMTLLIVGVAYRLDLELHTSYIRDAVVIAFIANEVISIVENAGLMGLPVPNAITNAIEVLKDKEEK